MVNSLIAVIAATALTATFIGCAATDNLRFSSAKNLEVGGDEDMALCRDFQLTENQSVQFLNQSSAISAREIHDHYNYLPCYVKGTVINEGQECDFTIRAGGTAELVCDGGESYILACDDCEGLLTD